MDRTGVAPIPALNRTTGLSFAASVKLPLGALTCSSRRRGPGRERNGFLPFGALYADAIRSCARRTRHRIAAQDGRGFQTQFETRYWPGSGAGKGDPSLDSRASRQKSGRTDSLWTAATRSGRKPRHAGGGEGASPELPPARLFPRLRATPPAILSTPSRALEYVRRAATVRAMAGQIQQPVNFCHGDLLGPVGFLHNFIAGTDFAFFDDAEVEPGTLVGNQQAGHLRLTQANADPVAGDSRLRYLKHCPANAVAVADADLVVTKALDGQVLAELTVLEVILFSWFCQ